MEDYAKESISQTKDLLAHQENFYKFIRATRAASLKRWRKKHRAK